MPTLNIPVTQAITTRAALDAAIVAGTVTRGRIYLVLEASGDYTAVVGTDVNAALEIQETRTKGKLFTISDAADSTKGALGHAEATDSVILAYLANEEYSDGDGAIVLRPGHATVSGAAVTVMTLASSGTKQVWVNAVGDLLAVEPPNSGWQEFAADEANYDLGAGTTVGPWVKLVGTAVTLPQDVPDGMRVDISATCWVVNKTTNRSGAVAFGIGTNDAEPLAEFTVQDIPPKFNGRVATAGTVREHGGATASDTFTLWARLEYGDNSAFGADIMGTSHPSELSISTPAAEGITDHSALTGLDGDDHVQYLTDARGDARYATLAQGALASTAVQPARTITAGTGLTGGGNLSADRTLTVSFGATAATACIGNDARLSDARAPNITGMTEIGAALVDADEMPVYDLSATANRKSLMSRVWTYVKLKIESQSVGIVPYLVSYIEKTGTLVDAEYVDLNPYNGPIQLWTLGASRIATADSFTPGQSITLMVQAGAFTITWPNMTWVDGSPPELAPTGKTVIGLWKAGLVLYGGYIGDVA